MNVSEELRQTLSTSSLSHAHCFSTTALRKKRAAGPVIQGDSKEPLRSLTREITFRQTKERSALAIFVKTPELSPVKTRLWPSLGRERSEQFHRHAAAAVASVVTQVAELESYYAVAEPLEDLAQLAGLYWADLPCLEQGDGDLGARMARVHASLLARAHGAILIGADAPQLEAASLAKARDWLRADSPRCVLGPAHDGGFWLFGSNYAIPTGEWSRVHYSRSDTAQAFLELWRASECLQLETLRDVDQREDVAALREALVGLRAPTEGQIRLRDWLNGMEAS